MSTKDINTKDQAEPPSTRWWESYLVRYFVGFIVGGICVSAIIYQTGLLEGLISYFFDSQAEKKPDWTALIFAVGFLGIMFCYIASAPITVLHTGRYGRGFLDAHSRHFWFGWLIACFLLLLNFYNPHSISKTTLIVCAVFVLIGICWLPITKNYGGFKLPCNWKKDHEQRCCLQSSPALLLISQSLLWAGLILILFSAFSSYIEESLGNGKQLSEFAMRLWMLAFPVVWIGVTQYVVLFRLLNEHNEFIKFYEKLFRARRKSAAKDVRDSYTHLREHSNSVFIVVVELAILALILAFIKTSKEFEVVNQSEILVIWLLFGLAFWMIPTVFMWARANAMERDFADDSDRFLL